MRRKTRQNEKYDSLYSNSTIDRSDRTNIQLCHIMKIIIDRISSWKCIINAIIRTHKHTYTGHSGIQSKLMEKYKTELINNSLIFSLCQYVEDEKEQQEKIKKKSRIYWGKEKKMGQLALNTVNDTIIYDTITIKLTAVHDSSIYFINQIGSKCYFVSFSDTFALYFCVLAFNIFLSTINEFTCCWVIFFGY